MEKKRNGVVERERQKAIRSTEEVVRREEETKRLEVSCNSHLNLDNHGWVLLNVPVLYYCLSVD